MMALLPLSPEAVRQAAAIRVAANGDLQGVIDRAKPGDTILLAAGARFSGSFVLPAHGGSAFITIRTDAPGLPGPGVRTSPRHAGTLAVLQSPGTGPALRTAPRAHHWRIENVAFGPNRNGDGNVIALGDAQTQTLAAVPHTLVLDRVYIYGDPAIGQKRGIALNSGATTISNSHISGIRAIGQDSQAIAGWNGPGPYRIENNYLEAAGENFLLGGGDPSIKGLIAEDVIFRRNHLAKPVEWRGQRWVVKNLFQLKNARKVLVEENLMEYTWRHGQVGYAIVLSPRNQGGRADWTTVEDVTIRRNVVRHAGGGMQIIGEDSNHPSGPTRNIRITDNLFYDLDARRWGGTGAFALIGDGPSDVLIEHNTISQSGNIVMAYGGRKGVPKTVENFVFRGNVTRHNQYGVHGADRAPGRDSLEAFFPGAVFEGNVIAGGSAKRYPDGNRFIDAPAFDTLFVATAEGDFRPAPGGLLAKPGNPRAGAHVEAVMTAIAGVARRSTP